MKIWFRNISITFKPKKENENEIIEYLESTYVKFRLAKGSFDPYSYRFWSWGQDIQTHDIKDTSSNTPESCKARLNKKVLTSHQKFPTSAQVVWESHGDVLDSYTQIFKHRETPSNKRKLATTHRNLWDCSVLSGPKYKIMLDLNDSLDKTALMIDLMSLNLEYWNHDNEQCLL